MRFLCMSVFAVSVILLAGCGKKSVERKIVKKTPPPRSVRNVVIGTTLVIRDGLTYAGKSLKPFTGVSEDYYDNGQLREECECKDGQLDGLAKSWDEKGKLTSEDHYSKGKVVTR